MGLERSREGRRIMNRSAVIVVTVVITIGMFVAPTAVFQEVTVENQIQSGKVGKQESGPWDLELNVQASGGYIGNSEQTQDTILKESIQGSISALVEHDSIHIDGNINFHATAEVENWKSEGTPSNPYVIDRLRITDTSVANLVDILSTAHNLTKPTIIQPNGGETLNGTYTIQWTTVNDSMGHSISYWVYYSSDGGDTWDSLSLGVTNTNYVWNTSSVSDGTNYKVKVVAACIGGISTESISNGTFIVQNVVIPSSALSLEGFFFPILLVIAVILGIAGLITATAASTSIRQQNLTDEFVRILSQRFPGSRVRVVSNAPHMVMDGSPSSPFAKITAKVGQINSGDQDLLVTGSLRDKRIFPKQSFTLQPWGISKISSRKTVKVGDSQIDREFRVQGDKPFARTFLLDSPSLMGSVLLGFEDLERFYVRGDQVSIRKKTGGTKSLQEALTVLEKSIEQLKVKPPVKKPKVPIREIAPIPLLPEEPLIEPVRDYAVPPSLIEEPPSLVTEAPEAEEDLGLSKNIKAAFDDLSFEIKSIKYLPDGNVEATLFLGAIKEMCWEINPEKTKLMAVGELSNKASLKFRLVFLGEGEFDFFKPFKHVEIYTEDDNLRGSIERKTEIGSALYKFVGAVEVNTSSRDGKLSIDMEFRTEPKNINQSLRLTKDLAWFLDVSLL